MQVKDVPDDIILAAIFYTPGNYGQCITMDNWRNRVAVYETLYDVLDYDIPPNLFQAKLRNMYKRKLIDGCCMHCTYRRACGGRIHLMAECPGAGRCGA